MSLFLAVVPVSKAIETVKSLAVRMPQETVPLEEARGRVLAEDIFADIDIPGFTRSVMDGYALRSAETAGAGEAVPAMFVLRGRITMGHAEDRAAGPGECWYIPTGGILPEGTDAVVMAENAELIGDDILVKKPVANGENVIRYNEDFKKGGTVLSRGHRLLAQDLGVLAAVGCAAVPVTRMPRIGILSTGNELVPVKETPAIGQVRDVNSFVLSAFVRDLGCVPVPYGIIRDDRDAFRTALSRGSTGMRCRAHIGGGAQKTTGICPPRSLPNWGEVLVHGVAIAPGKPTVIGRCGTVPVIGLPGHPAATVVVFVAIVRHLIEGMTGIKNPSVVMVPATLGTNVPSTKGREDYIRVSLCKGIATPLFGKSGLLNTLANSDGLLRIPAESEGIESGTRVEILLW